MCRYVFILVGTCILITTCNSSKISDLRLCADENCETTISHAKSLARVNNPDTTFLSFERGSVVNVISKSAGNRPDLWGGEVNGRRGYFPRSFVREFHVLVPNPEKIVPTEPHLSIEEKILGQKVKADDVIKKEVATPDKTEQPEKDETEVVDETEIADDEEVKEASAVTESKDEEKQLQDAGKQESMLKQAKQEEEKETTKKHETEKQDESPKQNTQETDIQPEMKTDSETEKVVQKDAPSEPGTSKDLKQTETKVEEDETEIDKEFEDDWEDETEMQEEEDEEMPKIATKLNDILHHREEQKAEDDKPATTNTKTEELPTPNEKKEQDNNESNEKLENVPQQIKEGEQVKPIKPQEIKHDEQAKQDISADEKSQGEMKMDEKETQKVQEEKTQKENINKEGHIPKNIEEKAEDVNVDSHTIKQEKTGEEGSVETGTITQDSATTAEQMLKPPSHTDGQPAQVTREQSQINPEMKENVQDDTEPTGAATGEESAHVSVVQQTETSGPSAEATGDVKSSAEEEHKMQNKVEAVESQLKSEGEKTNMESQVSHEQVKENQKDFVSKEQQDNQLKFKPSLQEDVKEEDKLKQDQEVQSEIEMHQDAGNEMKQQQVPVKDTIKQSKEESDPSKLEETHKADKVSQEEQSSAQDTEQPLPKVVTPETKTLDETKVVEKPVQVSDVKPDLTKKQPSLSETKYEEQTRYSEDVHSSQTTSFTQDVSRQEATPVLEPSTTQSVNTGSDMEGYTVIDGTPFPLDYFDDPTEMEKSVNMATSQSEIVPTPVLMNTQTDVRHNAESFHTETQPSYREEEKPDIDIDQNIQHTSEQLMSSMEVEQVTIEQSQVTEAPEIMQANQTNMDKETSSNHLPDQVAADNKDGMYATMDFLSRKPLSHDVNTQKSGNNEQQQQQELQERQQQQNAQQQYQQQLQEQEQPREMQQEQLSPPQQQQQEEDKNLTTLPPMETVTNPSYQQEEIPIPPTQEGKQQQNEAVKDENVDVRDKDTTTLPFSDFDYDMPKEYNTGNIQSRKIDDDKLEDQEDKEYKSQQIWTRAMRNLENRLKLVVEKLPPSVQSLLEQEPLGMSPWMTVLVTISAVLTIVTLTCVGLICGGSKKQKKKDPVIVVKGLEEQLFIMTKEKENLEDELQSVRASIKDKEKEILLQKTSTGSINTELNNLKVLNGELKHNIATMEAEIRELQSDSDQKTKTAQSKQDKLAESTKQLKQKETKLHEAEEKLKKTNKELNDNREELKTYKSKANSLTEQVQQLETRKKQLMDEAEDWDEKVRDLTERLTEATSGQKQIQEDLAFKENELEVLRDCFLQLKSFENETDENTDNVDGVDIQDKLKSMMDVSKINASLRTIEEEKNLLQHRIDIEIQARAEMEEQIADLERKAESLQMDKMKADRQSQDLQTKLNVLSNYFKEKELQLQKELGEQQALKKENINKLESAGEKTQMIEHERDIFKMQVEDLKAEIVSAEKDFRSQIATNEKKAHENWLAARSAERELKEARHDNTVLRQKLTDLERRLLQGPSGLIRPLPTRGIPPQGLMNGPPPPPPGMERPGSRPPPGPPLRDDEYRGSPDRPVLPPGVRVPPPHLDSRSPPLGPRMPPPPMDTRTPPPFDRRPPHDRRSPPLAFERGIRYPPPPPHMDRRSPGYRMPPPDMSPLFRGPFPPRGPTSPPPPRNELPDSNRYMGSGTPRYPPPQERDHTPRQQSQV